MKKMGLFFCVSLGMMTVYAWMPVYADRGGWADPPGGWTFVEEWHAIPDSPGNSGVWDHNNGSDTYSMNAHSALFGQDVARIDTVVGKGDTENGVSAAADAISFTLVDLGDPRALAPDPSDRKQFFLAPLHEPGFIFENDDPFVNGVTFAARFRIVPMPGSDVIGSVNLSPIPETITYIPVASRRAQVGLGFIDPAFTDLEVLIGVGYYAENTLAIIGDGAVLLPIAENIDNTQFHSIWINAKAVEEDYIFIQIRAFVDGDTTPIEYEIVREGAGGAGGDPESLQSNAAWTGNPELS
ncbi:MAG: hypothetical protein C4527_08475, partial [Candidatus Omnitrophota bacterium]